MFKLLRFLISCVFLGVFIWFGTTVPLGNHTLFGHFARIWHSAETQDLVKGTKEKAGPAVKRLERGIDEVAKDDPDAGPAKSPTPSPPAPPPAPPHAPPPHAPHGTH